MDNYKTIKLVGEGIYKEKGSKFLSFAHPINSEKKVKEILGDLQKTYHNARHVCYAYKLGYNEASLYRINDDGEPSGTAGKPIFGQILSHELTDILIVVVRYFGGTKLGVSGLINAYKSAAYEAVQNTEIQTKVRTKMLAISYDFALTNEVLRTIRAHKLNIYDEHYNTACHLKIKAPLSDYKFVEQSFKEIPGVDVKIEEKS